MIKILFIWEVKKELKEYLNAGLKNTPVSMIFPECHEEDSYLNFAGDVDIIVGWRPTPKLLKEAKNLKLFINPGAGVQHLLEMFTDMEERNITLVNGHGNAFFTAQHIMGMLISVTNNIIPHHNWMKQGKWRLGDKEAKSIPLNQRTIGLLGYGRINKTVHKMLSPFEANICILKRSWGTEENDVYPSAFQPYEPDDLHSFLVNIDTLIIALPHTKETEGLIGMKELKLLGKKGIVVNAGRGSIIKEEDFYNALKEGVISAAAIDVWYDYKPEPDEKERLFPTKYPFYKLDNVLLSPHRAASPFDDLKRWDEVIENIIRFSNGESLINEVDVRAGY